MTPDEIAAARARIEWLLSSDDLVRVHYPARLAELAQIALRALAHLEHATSQGDRARDLVAAVELKARAGTLDELLVAALANYKR